MTQLEYIMNHCENWEEEVSKPPYSLKVIHDGPYVMLKYNQLESDMGLRIVQEARGIIFRKIGCIYQCVCHPFHKFFNYGEKYAATIDWNTAVVTEKIDGSLMKVWYDDGWRLSTNGTINAFQAPVNDQGISFGHLFEEILGKPIDDFFKYWDQSLTYLFEMTSMRSQVTIPYPDRIYMLAWINTETGEELPVNEGFCLLSKAHGLYVPRIYKMSSLTECIAAANLLSKNEEGFVVADGNGHRIKVKSPEYLIAAHLANNGALTRGRILEAICNDQVDDLIAYVPQAGPMIKEVQEDFNIYVTKMAMQWFKMEKPKSRKLFAAEACKYPYARYLFARYEGQNVHAAEWLKSQSISRLKELLGYK